MYIWQHDDWPHFTYDASRYLTQIAGFFKAAERTFGRLEGLSQQHQDNAFIDLMVSEAITTSAIEGEQLNRASVQSSIKAFIGLTQIHHRSYDPKEEGIAALMVSVHHHWNQALTEDMLCKWQEMVVIDSQFRPITRGDYRQHASPMQIVSGAIGKQKVHYVAPPSDQVPAEMEQFINWYNRTDPINGTEKIPGLIRAGIAHAWFEIIHPFEDGNGRVGRAIIEHALSQTLGYPNLASLSTAIATNRTAYYDALGNLGQQGMNLNPWLDYFIETTETAQAITKLKIDFTLNKARFYDTFAGQLNERQAKVVARIFAEGIKGFEGGLTNKKYRAITQCSPTTATRDIIHLLRIGALDQREGGGRSTHYTLATIDQTLLSRWRSTQKPVSTEETNP